MPKSVPLSDAMGEYRQHMLARNLSANTVKNNLQPIGKGLALWGDILCSSVSPRHIDRLFQHEDWSPSTRNLYLGQVRLFFAWCRRHGYVPKDYDPTDGWRNVRVPKVERMRIPVEDFPSLLDSASHPRDRMVCALGVYTFMRGSEIQTLRIRDYDKSKHTLHIYRHKTREEDTLPVCEELAREFDVWLRWYAQDRNSVLNPDWYLVPAKGPNPTIYDPFTRRLVQVPGVSGVKPECVITHPYRAVQRTMAALGYSVMGEGEHTLRRSGARALFDELRTQGYDGALMRVSSMLGHRDTRVTERYIGLGLERTQRNEMLAGKPMFPSRAEGVVIQFRSANGERD